MHENFYFCSLKQKIARFDSIDRIKLRLLCIGTVQISFEVTLKIEYKAISNLVLSITTLKMMTILTIVWCKEVITVL